MELARISQEFPSRAGQESVKYESAQFFSSDSVLKHIEVDKDEQTRSVPAIGKRSRNKLERRGLGSIPQITILEDPLTESTAVIRFINFTFEKQNVDPDEHLSKKKAVVPHGGNNRF